MKKIQLNPDIEFSIFNNFNNKDKHMAILFKKISAPAVLLLALLTLTGCAGDMVNLHYVPVGPVSQNSGKHITLLELEDRRPQTAGVGQRQDGGLFTSDARVTDWVSRALADEFTRQGAQVYYAGEGVSSPGSPTVSGSVDELWLLETGNTSYEVNMTITLNLIDSSGKRIYTESFRCKQTAQFIPSESNISNLMADTLRDLVAPAAQTMTSRI